MLLTPTPWMLFSSYADGSATACAMSADVEDFTAQAIAYVYVFADITING